MVGTRRRRLTSVAGDCDDVVPLLKLQHDFKFLLGRGAAEDDLLEAADVVPVSVVEPREVLPFQQERAEDNWLPIEA